MTSKHCHLEAASAICSRLWVLAASHPRYFQELKNSLQSRHHTGSPMNVWLNGKCSCNANGLLRRCVIMSGVAQWLACWAHNPKVRGSKPRSATFLSHLLREGETCRASLLLLSCDFKRSSQFLHYLCKSHDTWLCVTVLGFMLPYVCMCQPCKNRFIIKSPPF